MKHKKIFTSIVAMTIILITLCGCIKAEKNRETEAEQATTVGSSDMKETDFSDETESSETSEMESSENTESSEETSETLGDYEETETEKERKDHLNDLYAQYREYATSIQENSDGKELLYGYSYDRNIDDYVLLVYDLEKGLTTYYDNEGEIVETCYEMSEYDYHYGDEAYKYLLGYSDFMDIPFLNDFPDTEGNFSNYGEAIEDGYYGGCVYGFSKNSEAMYCSIGPVTKLDLTVDECMELKKGDKVLIYGEEEEVKFTKYLEEDIFKFIKGDYLIYFVKHAVYRDFDYGYAIAVHMDKQGNATDYDVYDYRCADNFPYYHTFYFEYDEPIFTKVPIAADCEIELDICTEGYTYTGETISIKRKDLEEYIEKCKFVYLVDNGVAYEDDGYRFYYDLRCWGEEKEKKPPLLIENGEIVYFRTQFTMDDEVLLANAKARLRESFTQLRNYATELYEEDEFGDWLLFGYGKYTELPEEVFEEYVLYVYDPYDGLKGYRYVDGVIEELDDDFFDYLDKRALAVYGAPWNPEDSLLPYDIFIEFPGFYDFRHWKYSLSMYDQIWPDGDYSGIRVGFSEDMKYAYFLLDMERGSGDTYYVKLPIDEECDIHIGFYGEPDIDLHGRELEEYISSHVDESWWIHFFGDVGYGCIKRGYSDLKIEDGCIVYLDM